MSGSVFTEMAITATYALSDTKKVAHVHLRENGIDLGTFVVTFTTRANLRSKLQAIASELSAELTRIRGEV